MSRLHSFGAAYGLILVAALSACGKGGNTPTAGGPPGGAPKAGFAGIPARVLEVKAQRVPITLEAIGQVEGSKEVEVRARVTGIVLKRLYGEGELVRAGDPMFQIDPAPFEIGLAQARAALAQERARNEQARREAGRLKQLAAEKAISQREFDDATSNLRLSDASLQAAEARVREAELNLSYTRVNAPISGVSGRALKSEGSLVTAGADSLLSTINQVNPIWVRFSLSESDTGKLPGKRLGRDAAEVRLALPDGSRFPGKGRINFSAAQIDPRLGTRQLRAEFENESAQLLPGQFVRVQLVAGQRENVFLVPQVAVLQNPSGHFVFVLDGENKAAIRPVNTGEWIGSDWIITTGLSAGERVIVDNLLRLQPGVPVVPAPEGSPASGAGAAPAKK